MGDIVHDNSCGSSLSPEKIKKEISIWVNERNAVVIPQREKTPLVA
jgi:hypothetical protein